MLYARKLRRRDPRRTIVVVVERGPNHPALTELRDGHRALIASGDCVGADCSTALMTVLVEATP